DALASCEAGHDDLALTDDRESALQRFAPHLIRQIEAAASGDPARALGAITEARVLTAQRLGPVGAATWNARIEALLARHGHRTEGPYYVGRPILVTSNDHQSRIWNGDLGIVGRDAHGTEVVWMYDQHGELRALNPRRLPAHETAWAMTVHKAQGSEFDHVLLLPPERSGPLNTASLIYTGVTRARRSALICADRATFAAGLADWPERRSGLCDALSRAAAPPS
ncbi:MAG TPA: exodeoxyribonuclease V subunit alpha, partial [bacterium]|nr:exodeoxyribonuclease V subunit alpha [bacterium]